MYAKSGHFEMYRTVQKAAMHFKDPRTPICLLQAPHQELRQDYAEPQQGKSQQAAGDLGAMRRVHSTPCHTPGCGYTTGLEAVFLVRLEDPPDFR